MKNGCREDSTMMGLFGWRILEELIGESLATKVVVGLGVASILLIVFLWALS
jgi:hypothetical protein